MRHSSETHLVLLAVVLAAAPLAAQTRNERIAAAFGAYDNFQPDQALDLVRRAVNPSEGPADSVWFRGVQLLAQILIERNQPNEAGAWLRWALRLAPNVTVDSVNFVPEVVSRARQAQAAVQGGSPGDSVTRTTWEWVAPGAGPSRGLFRIESGGMAQPVRALVQGQIIESGRSLALAPGTYEVQAAAEGYLRALVRREVLPGVTTVLSFNLAPIGVAARPVAPAPAPAALSEASRVTVQRQLFPITINRFGAQPACGTGVFVAGSGLVLTSYQTIRGAERVEVEIAGGRRLAEEVRVAAYDTQADLTVLQIPAIRPDSLPVAATVAPGQPVWGFGLINCRTPQDLRLGVSEAAATLQLADSAPSTIGPLVNAAGAMAGYLTGGRSAAGPARIAQLLDQARRNALRSDVLTVGQVALRQNHAFGSMAISSDAAGAEVRITPLETWQWPSTAMTGALPLTFAGPMGRYRLQLLAAGQVQRELEFTVRAATGDRLAVPTQVAAPGPRPTPVTQPRVARRGGGFPWVVPVILAVGGGGAAAYFLTRPKVGTITIKVSDP